MIIQFLFFADSILHLANNINLAFVEFNFDGLLLVKIYLIIFSEFYPNRFNKKVLSLIYLSL